MNAAAIKALEGRTINSASLMVPCPWFPRDCRLCQITPGRRLRSAPHVASERIYYRWGPVAPSEKVASLLDQNGYFHHDWEANAHIDAREVEVELRAQIEHTLRWEFAPRTSTHTSTG